MFADIHFVACKLLVQIYMNRYTNSASGGLQCLLGARIAALLTAQLLLLAQASPPACLSAASVSWANLLVLMMIRSNMLTR